MVLNTERLWKIAAANICFFYRPDVQINWKFPHSQPSHWQVFSRRYNQFLLDLSLLLSLLFLSLFIVFFSMALSSYRETWEKTLQVYIWNRFQLCFPSAWAVMVDYIVNISYPLVKVFRKWTHFHKIDEVLMLSIMSCCVCQVSQWTVSKTFLYNYVICTL